MGILDHKYYQEASVFKPENLLREARRQKTLQDCPVPALCVLDPDGDILDYLLRSGQAEPDPCWACYHSKLYQCQYQDIRLGIIARAVGASYAVLLAEQLFVSGCQLLLSITSAGMINLPAPQARFILIEEALRDEGTSYHYLPAEEKASMADYLLDQLKPLMAEELLGLGIGKSWTTDAPYRETPSAIQAAKQQGVTAVEMEAAALYAFAQARNKAVICLAHLTNAMAQHDHDFEKGEENGSLDSLQLIYHIIKALKK